MRQEEKIFLKRCEFGYEGIYRGDDDEWYRIMFPVRAFCFDEFSDELFKTLQWLGWQVVIIDEEKEVGEDDWEDVEREYKQELQKGLSCW